MIEGNRELTKKIFICADFFLPNREAAIEGVSKVIAEHYGVPPEDVEWRDFRKPGWHVDPAGRFFIKGEPLRITHYLEFPEESEE